jgi:hypothetical protein
MEKGAVRVERSLLRAISPPPITADGRGDRESSSVHDRIDVTDRPL